jgi:hypothetical protein
MEFADVNGTIPNPLLQTAHVEIKMANIVEDDGDLILKK